MEIRNAKLVEMQNIINLGKTESRMLTEDEQKKLTELENEIKSLDKIKINQNKMENFSLLRSIRNIVEHRAMDEATIAMNELGRKSSRNLAVEGQIQLPVEFEKRADIIAGSAGALLGSEVVREDKFNLIGPLRASSVIFQAGAQLMTGLVGDISIPTYAGSNASWVYETSGATDSSGAFAEITLAPKRLTNYIDISKQFLIQDSASAEALLYSDLQNAIMDVLEGSILDATAASQIRPAGICNGATQSFTGTTTWASIVNLEAAIANNNALVGSLAYMVHPSTMAVLKSTAKSANTAIFLAEGNTMNGYPVFKTTHMPTLNTDQKQAIFANWSDLIVGQWGPIDLTVDPYTVAVNGKVRLVINSYWDFKIRRSASFAFAGLK